MVGTFNLNFQYNIVWKLKGKKTMNVTAKLIVSPGAVFQEIVTIKLEDIYIPKTDVGGNNNPARYTLDIGNVNALAESLRNAGQDLSLPLPVVEKLPKPLKIDGKIYTYRLVCGAHRCAAGTQVGLEVMVFSVYQFESDSARLRFQLVENNHAPSKGATAQDLCNALTYGVFKGFIQNDEESMREYLRSMDKIHGNTINKAIQMAIRDTGGYQDYHIYTPEDIENFVKKHNYVMGGKRDKIRDQAGWTVKEGYEYEYLMNAIKKFSTEQLESYFICHTKSPTERNSLDDKREGMLEEFNVLEKALVKVFDYYKENKSFPWRVEGFLPQDNNRGEREIVTA